MKLYGREFGKSSERSSISRESRTIDMGATWAQRIDR